MACPLPTIKTNKTHDAMDTFQQGASSVRLNKENNTAIIRWGNEYKVKTRDQAVRMIQQKMKHVEEWSAKTFGKSYQDWVVIDGIDNSRAIVKFKFPYNLETRYIIKLAKEGDPDALKMIEKDPYRFNLPGSKPKEEPPTMAQLENEGRTVLPQLEKLMTAFFDLNQIKIRDSKDYAIAYELRTGKKLTAVAYASIADNFIMVSQGRQPDGTTMLEEAMHFVVYHLWNSGRLDGLKNETNANGIPWFKTTEEWKDHSIAYEEFYRDTQGRSDWMELRDQEIITKIITNHIYELSKANEYTTKRPNAFKRLLDRFITWLMNLGNKKNADGSPQFNFPKRVKEDLGDVASNFLKKTLDLNNYREANERLNKQNNVTPADFVESKTLNLQSPETLLLKVEKALRRSRLQKVQNVNALFNRRVKKAWQRLTQHYSIETVEVLQENLETYRQAQLAGTLTEDQAFVMNELLTLEKLFDRSAEDQAIANEISDLNDQISAINRQIKEKEFQRGLRTLIHGVVYLDPVDGEYKSKAALIDQLQEVTKNINDAIKEISGNEFSKVTIYPLLIKGKNYIEDFEPLLHQLESLSRADKEDSEDINDLVFDDLSKSEIANLKQGISKAAEQMGELRRAVEAGWEDVGKKEITKTVLTDVNGNSIPGFGRTAAEDLMSSPQMDIWYVTKMFGSKANMGPWAIQKTLATVAILTNRAKLNTQAKVLHLHQKVVDNNEALLKNPIVKKYMKQFGFSRPLQLVMEMNPKNIPSGYYIGKYHMGRWVQAQKEAEESILNSVEAFIKRTYNTDVVIPRGDDSISISKRRKYIIEETNYLLTEEERKRNINPIVNHYNMLWGKWLNVHTQPRSDVKAYIAQKKFELGALAFQEWYKQNVTEFEDDFGNVKEYYKGELTVPSGAYIDKAYEELSTVPEFMDIYDEYTVQKEAADDKYPEYVTSTYEWRRRMPQISNDNYDAAYRLMTMWRGDQSTIDKLKESGVVFMDRITDIWKNKVDDDFVKGQVSLPDDTNNPIYMPPIRFVAKLEKPETLTRDVLGALSTYIENSEMFFEIMSNLPYFEAIKEVVARSKVNQAKPGLSFGKEARKRSITTIKGDKSRIYESLEDIATHELFGQGASSVTVGKDGKYDITKLSKNVFGLIRNVYLQGANIAVVMGKISAIKESVANSFVGRTTSTDAALFANLEYGKNFHKILNDWQRPIKTCKHTALAQRFRVLDDNREMFKDTDKLLWLNRIGAFANYGVWRAADHGTMMNLMIAQMYNYRFINNKWYDREIWFRDNPEGQKTWEDNESNSMFNKYQFVKGKLVEGKYDAAGNFIATNDIKEAQINLMTNRIKLDGRDVRMQKTDLDRAAIDSTPWGHVISMFRGFMSVGLSKRFKPTMMNIVTERVESGTHNYGIDAAFMPHKNGADIRVFLGLRSGENLTPEQREGRAKVWFHIAWMNIAWMMYVLAHSNIDDDDPVWAQFIKYLSTRTYMESQTFASPWDFIGMLTKPIPGMDWMGDIGDIISSGFQSTKKPKKRKKKQEVIYLTSKEALMSLLIPGYKGAAESSIFQIPGIGNPALAMNKKDTYLDNTVTSGFNPLVPGTLFINSKGETFDWLQDNWIGNAADGLGKIFDHDQVPEEPQIQD